MIRHDSSKHFLTENPEYLDYNYVGVGYQQDKNSISEHYFVFISAPPEKIETPEQRSQMKSKCEELYRQFKTPKATELNAGMQLIENECSDTLGKRCKEIVGRCGT